MESVEASLRESGKRKNQHELFIRVFNINSISNDSGREVLYPFCRWGNWRLQTALLTPLPALKCPKAKRSLRSLFHLYSFLGDFIQSTALNVVCPLMTFTLIALTRALLRTAVWLSSQPAQFLHLDITSASQISCVQMRTFAFSQIKRGLLWVFPISANGSIHLFRPQVKILQQSLIPVFLHVPHLIQEQILRALLST